MNPEFRRNLWLQFSPLRLAIAPAAVGIVLLLVWLVSDNSYALVAHAAEWYFLIIVLLWGTRRAADLVAEEVAGGTWDSQRMSALGAWTMTWGKFIGGISYVWYSAGFAFAVRLWAQNADGMTPFQGSTGIENLDLLGVGLFGQSVSFLASLVLLRKQVGRRRLGVTLSQFTGLLAAAIVPGHIDIGWFQHNLPAIDWYGRAYRGPLFALVSLALFLGWSLFGGYRLMRSELQFRSMPWAWLGFALFLMVYGDGLLYRLIVDGDDPFTYWSILPFGLAYFMTYAALFLEPKDVVRYRAFAAALEAGQVPRALTLLPQWVPIFVVAAMLGIPLTLFGSFGGINNLADLAGPAAWIWRLRTGMTFEILPLALVLYLLRDILLVLFFNFGGRGGRADLIAIIVLVIAYLPASGVLAMLHADVLIPILAPYPTASPLISIAAPGIEAGIVAALVLQRMRAAGRFRPVPA
jgi:hypothetical protein